ncbi:hypothetical protein GCM10009836_52190 [Pseudonocardia ailaonensis]|uniref:Uncharacterized protein n=1 Tax=Pseudonocardia ailaonensis TaxID=367279 RepID=A0ABN2NE93_9PSEU
MSSPGGTEVGRVSIKVVPDTSGFRRQLQAALTGLPDVTINAELDAQGLRQKVQAAAAAAGAGVNAEVGVDVDRGALAQVGNTIRNALSNVNMPDFLAGGRSSLDQTMRNVVDNANRIRASLERVAIGFREMTNSAANIRGHFQGLQSAAGRVGSAIRRIGMPTFERDVMNGQTAFQRFSQAVYTGLTRLGSALGSGLSTAFSGVGRALNGLGEAGSDAFGQLSRGMSGASRAGGAILGVVMQVVMALVQAGAVATVISIAGAGITAAWGAASAAIAAVPAAIGLLAAPIAAVMIGMDGIKEAARTLAPEFDRLQTAVERAFVRGLTPAFNTLRAVFPVLQTGLVGTATALGTVAQGVARVVAEGPGLANLQATFANVNAAITGMGPGINAIVAGFLQITAQTSAFEALTNVVNTLGESWQQSVQQMTAGARGATVFDQAMKGLEGTLIAVGQGLISLVQNGLTLFANAAPGINAVIESITGFFNRFDWAGLGASVGGVFQGIADAINAVPTATITGIEQAFARLSAVFQNPAIQNAITALINSLPYLIDMLARLTQGFIAFAAIAMGVIQIIDGIAQAAVGLITMDWGKITEGTLTAMQGFDTLKAGIDAWGADVNASLGGFGAQWGTSLGTSVTSAYSAAQNAAATGIPGLVGTLQANSMTMAEAMGVPDAAAGSIPPQWRDLTVQTGTQAAEGMNAGVPGLVGAAGALGQATAPVGDLTAPWAAGVAPIPGTVQTGLADVPTVVQGTVDGLAPIVSGAFTGLQSYVLVGTAQLAQGVRDGGAAIPLAIQEVFGTQAGAAITTAMTGLSAQITAGMAGLAAQVTAGMPQITTAFQTGFDSVSTQMNSSFTLILNGLTVQMASMATAVTMGMATVQAAFTNGFAVITPAVLAGFTGAGLAAQTGMLAMQTAVTVGMAAIQAAVITGMAAVNAALATGFVSAGAAAIAAMASMVAAVVAGMAQMVAAVTSGTGQMQAAWVSGWAAMQAATLAAVAAMVAALTGGMAQALAVVQSSIAAMVGALQAAVGQFRAAGANMGAALADGLRSQAGNVRAAAAELANAAAAATAAAAQIRSPSRVFLRLGRYIGQGFRIGIERETSGVVSAAHTLVTRITRVFDGMGGMEVRTTLVPDVDNTSVQSVSRVAIGSYDKHINSDDYGFRDDERLAHILAGMEWAVDLDRNGLTRIVNRGNIRRVRRG